MQSFNLSENIVSTQFYVAPPKLLPTASQASKALHCDGAANFVKPSKKGIGIKDLVPRGHYYIIRHCWLHNDRAQ